MIMVFSTYMVLPAVVTQQHFGHIHDMPDVDGASGCHAAKHNALCIIQIMFSIICTLLTHTAAAITCICTSCPTNIAQGACRCHSDPW